MTDHSTLTRGMKLGALLVRVTYYQTTGNRQALSQSLYNMLYELGGVYIKFLQSLLLRSDLFSNLAMIRQLEVYEQVAIAPLDIVARLDSQLGPSWRDQIIYLETDPFAAGSFAQVYRARLANGQAVVIKALRPNLRKTVKSDVRLLGLAAKTLTLLRPGGMIDIAKLFQEFKQVTLGEIDYSRETQAALMFYDRYKNHPSIYIPQTHVHLCAKDIIVQEYVGGISVSQLVDHCKDGVDPVAYIKQELGSDLHNQLHQLGYEGIYALFTHKTAQGDPHPGNVKLLFNNKIGLIDFGIVAVAPKDRGSHLQLLREYQKIYRGQLNVQSFTLSLLAVFAPRLVASMRVFGTAMHNPKRADTILGELAKVAEAVFMSKHSPELEQMLERGQITIVFSSIINEGNRFGLKLDYDAASMVRASQMYMAMINSLGLRRDIMPAVFERVIRDVEASQSDYLPSSHLQMSYERAAEVLSEWMDRIATTDPLLFGKMAHHLQRPGYV